MNLSRPDPLGIERNVAWAPTDDTARQRGLGPDTVLLAGRQWTPFGLMALSHQLTVNIATGGLVVSANDLTMPYHALRFQVARSLDVQEQHAQQVFLDSHPNTDPRPHLFANWMFAREAVVSAVWNDTFPELLLADGDGAAGLYYRAYPDFDVNRPDEAQVEERLRAYGVPGRTLSALRWSYEEFDSILRSEQGSFSVLSGDYRPETMVDPAVVRLYQFDVTGGVGYKYSSEFAYQQLINPDGSRETTVQSLVVDAVDALGHSVGFRPVEAQPPYRTYQLVDGSGRAFQFELADHIDYLDGDNPGGVVKTYVISHVIDETKAASNVVDYSYQSGRLVKVSYPGYAGGPARVYTYDYDDAGNLTQITDPVGDSFTIEYAEDLLDSDDRLIPRLKVSRLVDDEGNSASYEYDHAAGRVTVTFTGAAGDSRTVAYTYIEDENDTRQRYIISQTVDVSLGYSGSQVVATNWQYTTDGRYQLAATVDPLGGVTSFEYNDFNQTTSETDVTGHQRNFSYDIRAAPTASDPNRYDLIRASETNVDAQGNTFPVQTSATFVSYDVSTSADPADAAQSTHRVHTQTNELGAVSTFGYDELASFFPVRPTEYTDPLGDVATRAYDATGSLIRNTDAEGNTWRRGYNPQGQLVSLTDPNGFQRFRVYDEASGWLTDTTDALGTGPGDPAHSLHYEWTSDGQRARDSDPAGATIEYAYYPNKRVRSLTWHDPAPQTTSFAFDASGGLTEITDPRGHTAFFMIDEARRVYSTYRDSPANPATRVRFDAAGRAVEVIDRNGQSTLYGYDALGRVTSITEPDWPAGAPANPGKSVSIDYDELGRRLRVSDSDFAGEYVFGYDAAGNLTQRTDPFGAELLYAYDPRNDLVRLYDAGAVVDLRFVRDHAGRVTSVSDSAWGDPSRTFSFIYEQGPLVANLYGINAPSGLAASFTYNANRQLTSAVHQVGATTAANYGYAYRNDGLLGQATGDHVGEYDYDGMKRLIQETDSGVRDGYDGAGNRLWRNTQAPSPGEENVYDGDNRLTVTPATPTIYTYDANGNLLQRQPTAGESTRYEYDGASRLRRVENGTVSLAYVYDVDDRLLQRTRMSGNSTQVVRYRYANRSVLAQLDESNNVRALYTRSDQGRLLRRRTTEELLPAPSSDRHSLFYLHDGLGSVVGLLDWDGRKPLSFAYDAWGAAEAQGSGDGELFGYRAGFQDPDTGLLNFRHRWYDPALGRWISQDPLLTSLLVTQRDPLSSIAEISNLYAYVSNNPLNNADLTGLGPPGSAWSGFWNWVRSTILGKALDARMRAQGSRPETGVKGTPTQQVEKKAPQKIEKSGELEEKPEESEFEEGAGEGSRAPSTERIYNDPNRLARSGGGGGGEVAVVGVGVVAIGVVVALPEEAAGAVIYGVEALFEALL